MMAHRHKMNHGFRRAVLGLFLQGITIITPGKFGSEKKKKRVHNLLNALWI